MIDLERESLPIAREAVFTSLSALAPLLARLPEHLIPVELANGLPQTTGELAAEAIDEWDDGDGAVNFAQALILAHALSAELEVTSHPDALVLELEDVQAAIRHGAFTVGDPLELHGNLIVLGDLHVEGRHNGFTPPMAPSRHSNDF